MKRQVITIQEDMVIYAPHHGEVWMTVWEIAELLNVTGTAVKNTIKRIWKQSVLKDFQHSPCYVIFNITFHTLHTAQCIVVLMLSRSLLFFVIDERLGASLVQPLVPFQRQHQVTPILRYLA